MGQVVVFKGLHEVHVWATAGAMSERSPTREIKSVDCMVAEKRMCNE